MATKTMIMPSQTLLASKDGDLKASLNFFQRLDKPLEPLDFSKPGTEKVFDEVNKLQEDISLTIKNVRGIESSFNLDKNAFQYVDHEVPGLKDCKTEDEIRELLIPATEELVKKITGAYKTIVFTHRIRSLAEDSSKRADNRAPAHSVHTDFTPAGARKQLSVVLKGEAPPPGHRIMAINVWRPLKPIKKDPLTVCDWTTIDPKDIIPNRFTFQGGHWSELGKVQYSKGQDWYTMKGQTPSEPLVFKQFDSAVEGGMTLPHSAFVDPKFVDEEARESIEIKMFAFIEEN